MREVMIRILFKKYVNDLLTNQKLIKDVILECLKIDKCCVSGLVDKRNDRDYENQCQ